MDKYEFKMQCWLGGFVAATLVGITAWQLGWDWAILQLVVVAIACLIQASFYYLKSVNLGKQPIYQVYAPDLTVQNEPVIDSTIEPATEAIEIEPASNEQIKERVRFYVFLRGVCEQRIVGENAWKERGIPAATYREYMTYLQKYGVVRPGSPGIKPEPLMSLESAMEKFDSVMRANDPNCDYWEPVRGYYEDKNTTDKTILILPDDKLDASETNINPSPIPQKRIGKGQIKSICA